MQLFLTSLTASIIFFSSLGVVLTRNVVHAAIFLLVALIGVSALFLVQLAEFLALVQILIYAGAVIIVLMFSIMLTRETEQTAVSNNAGKLILGGASIVVFIGFCTAIFMTDWAITDYVSNETGRFAALGKALFSDFLVPFGASRACFGANWAFKHLGSIMYSLGAMVPIYVWI